MARGSTTALHHLRKHLQMPYHKLDQIREDDDPDDKLDFFESYQDEQEEEEGREHHLRRHEEALAARLQALRSKILSGRSSYSPMYRSGRGLRVGGSYVRRRNQRWRRMRLRICRVRLISWLSPVEFLKKLRRVYAQAISSSKESQCSLVMMGSPWSFPVIVPFRG